MKFRSTRGEASKVSLSEAITAGLAADSGLYVPDVLPHLDVDIFDAAAPLPVTAGFGPPKKDQAINSKATPTQGAAARQRACAQQVR